MVPDLSLSGREDDAQLAQVDNFHLYNASFHSTCEKRNFAAPKILPDHLPTQDIDLRPSVRGLTTTCAFVPALKNTPPHPLSSFYKINRLPQPPIMAETKNITTPVVELPLSTPHIVPETKEITEKPLQNGLQNGIHNKAVEHVIRTPGRQPSPQPTHLGVPGASAHRILQEEGPGYVAPKFEGKEIQMDQGECNCGLLRPPISIGNRRVRLTYLL
jgi:hypothetical protein